MKKTGIKTFVYSFVFSLSAILTADGLFLSAPKENTEDLKISDKNIILFFKNDPQIVSLIKNSSIDVASLDDIPSHNIYTPPQDNPPTIGIPISSANVEKEIKISSVEDVADIEDYEFNIPLERSENQQSQQVVDGNSATNIDSPPTTKTDVIAEKTKEADDAFSFAKVEENKPSEITKVSEIVPLKQKTENENRLDHLLSAPIPLIKEETSKMAATVEEKAENNEVALAPGDLSTKSLGAPSVSDTSDEKAPEDSPWVSVKGAKHTNNQMIQKESFYKKETESGNNPLLIPIENKFQEETKVADADTVKNIIIPIPKEIMKEDNTVPHLSYSKDNKEENVVSKDGDEEGKNATPLHQSQDTGKSLLKSISSIFSSNKDKGEIGNINSASVDKEADSIFKKMGAKFRPKRPPSKILPTEIRLSFQPNRAEISGQTLRWLQAFANKVNQDATVALEVRVDSSGTNILQQKRLELLYNILTNKGVESYKIKAVFTEREPNSFVIRTIRINANNTQVRQNNPHIREANYQRW